MSQDFIVSGMTDRERALHSDALLYTLELSRGRSHVFEPSFSAAREFVRPAAVTLQPQISQLDSEGKPALVNLLRLGDFINDLQCD